jgi:hypothetical protein
VNRNCDLCGADQQEVFAYEGNIKIRAGWLCTKCWPAEGSWHKAILRERWTDDSNNVSCSNDLSRSPESKS